MGIRRVKTLGSPTPPEIPLEKTCTCTGVEPTLPAGPARTPGFVTVACTSAAVLVVSRPAVVSVKLTLDPPALAVIIVCAKLRLKSVAPRNEFDDCPAESV